MAAGDTYRLRLEQNYYGSTVENVFYFFQNIGSNGASRLANAFVADLLPEILDVQVTTVTTLLVSAENLGNTADFDVLVDNSVGDRAGDGMPNFTAWGFIYHTADKKIRSGGKRFAGVSESDVDGGLANAAALVLLNDLADKLILELVGPQLDNRWDPVLWTPGNIATGGLELKVGIADISYARVSTQSSRKSF